MELGPGLRLAGRIDRVDRQGDRAVVIDYKGRSATPLAKWAADSRLQLALYALALPEVLEGVAEVSGALYQPLGADDRTPRGAMRDGADPGLNLKRTDRVDDAEFGELLEDARRRAVDAVQDVRRGALKPSPDTCAWNGGCSFPSICRCERG